jgi:hypothetical protein
MKVLAGVATAGTLLVVGLTACSSSGGSAAVSSPTPKPSTETIKGTLTGAEAMASSPVFHLTLSGPVSATSTTALGGSPRKGAAHTFKTGSGDLTVTLDSSGTSGGGLKSATTCKFAFTTTVPLTVDGARSTGKFAGATGTGRAVVVFSGNLPKLSNGKCDESRNAQPSAKTAAGAFTATIRMTVRH